jgi:hypothetical protein
MRADTPRSSHRAVAIVIDEVALAVPLDPGSMGRDRVVTRIARVMRQEHPTTP